MGQRPDRPTLYIKDPGKYGPYHVKTFSRQWERNVHFNHCHYSFCWNNTGTQKRGFHPISKYYTKFQPLVQGSYIQFSGLIVDKILRAYFRLGLWRRTRLRRLSILCRYNLHSDILTRNILNCMTSIHRTFYTMTIAKSKTNRSLCAGDSTSLHTTSVNVPKPGRNRCGNEWMNNNLTRLGAHASLSSQLQPHRSLCSQRYYRELSLHVERNSLTDVHLPPVVTCPCWLELFSALQEVFRWMLWRSRTSFHYV